MTQDQAGRLIIGSMAATALLAGTGEVLRKRVPRPRIVVGAFVAGIVLTMFSELTPEVAVGIALVMLIGTALNTAGTDTFTKLAAALDRGKE